MKILRRCCVAGISLLVLATFVSRVTVWVGKLRYAATETEKRFELMRKFMRAQKIPKPLAKRIVDFLSMLLADQRARVDEDKVDLIPLLSEELNGDLRRSIFQPRVKGFVPIAKLLKDNTAIALARLIATKACNLFRVMKQQQIFEENQTGRGMYFLSAGVFELTTPDSQTYTIGPDSEDPNFPPTGHVVKWLCEFAVVMPWIHKDRVVASMNGELVLIARGPFLECLDTDPARKEAFLADNAKRFLGCK